MILRALHNRTSCNDFYRYKLATGAGARIQVNPKHRAHTLRSRLRRSRDASGQTRARPIIMTILKVLSRISTYTQAHTHMCPICGSHAHTHIRFVVCDVCAPSNNYVYMYVPLTKMSRALRRCVYIISSRTHTLSHT